MNDVATAILEGLKIVEYIPNENIEVLGWYAG